MSLYPKKSTFYAFILLFLTNCSAPLPSQSRIAEQSNIRSIDAANTTALKLQNHQPMTVTMSRDGIQIDGTYRLIRGGSLQWFRIPESTWEDRLQKFKAMGFNTIDIYIAWNQIEPEEGHFNFDHPNLKRFLELAAAQGLFVAVRPGPFVGNEMDGGGLPAWLTRKSSKRSTAEDGLVNLRTNDPDFIQPVRRYLTALNQVLSPYQIQNGGPVLFYVIENEYTWFEQFFQIDKLFWWNGDFERDLLQSLNTKAYFTSLRDIVRETGIMVPILTCPGDGKPSATGDVPGVIPFPNIYEWSSPKQPEDIVYDLREEMGDSKQHGGAYQNDPAGTMEINRSPQEMRRFFMGGLDAVFVFNLAGIAQTGNMNAVSLGVRTDDTRPHWGPVANSATPGFLQGVNLNKAQDFASQLSAPQVAYLGGVIDYSGPISSSGVLRPMFYQFRRDNLFFDTVERLIGAAGSPQRTFTEDLKDQRLVVTQPHIGVPEDKGRSHYWHEAPNGTSFVSLVNQSGSPQVIDPSGINFKGLRFPRFVPFTVQIADEVQSTYAKILAINFPITSHIIQTYGTSEILTVRPYNQETLMIVYGSPNTMGELALTGEHLQIQSADQDVEIREHSSSSLVLTYSHRHGAIAVITNSAGETLRLFITTPSEAGRFWFLNHEQTDLVVSGLDFVGNVQNRDHQLTFEGSTQSGDREIVMLSPQPLSPQGWTMTEPHDPQSGISRFSSQVNTSLPTLPSLDQGKVTTTLEEAQADFDDRDWFHWTGEPRSLENLGIYTGHAWYRCEIFIEDLNALPNDASLFVAGAADFIGIYVNGHYLATVNPLGTEINNASPSSRYQFPSPTPYLKPGRNIIAFRTEIWGHGAFMFPRGTLLHSEIKISSIGYDGLKGLWGKATLGGIPMTQWSVRKGLSDQARLPTATDDANLTGSGATDDANLTGSGATDDANLTGSGATLPLNLEKGAITWYQKSFLAADLPDPKLWDAPLVLRLKGHNTKATIYLNGIKIGRWLSDSHWLEKGFWGRPQRGLWVLLSADDFPLPMPVLESTRYNTLSIALEDTSGPDEEPGILENLSLEYNNEEPVENFGATGKHGVRHQRTLTLDLQ